MAARRNLRKPQQKAPSRWPRRIDDDVTLGEELLRAARAGQAQIIAEWDRFMQQLGIRGKPIGAKKLRAMALREGLDPESSEFSRGIVEMREE